jgi:hypothetical protein
VYITVTYLASLASIVSFNLLFTVSSNKFFAFSKGVLKISKANPVHGKKKINFQFNQINEFLITDVSKKH